MSRVTKGDLCIICRVEIDSPGYEHIGKYVTATSINTELTMLHSSDICWNYEPALYCEKYMCDYIAIPERYLEPIKKFPVDELIETKEPAHV